MTCARPSERKVECMWACGRECKSAPVQDKDRAHDKSVARQKQSRAYGRKRQPKIRVRSGVRLFPLEKICPSSPSGKRCGPCKEEEQTGKDGRENKKEKQERETRAAGRNMCCYLDGGRPGAVVHESQLSEALAILVGLHEHGHTVLGHERLAQALGHNVEVVSFLACDTGSGQVTGQTHCEHAGKKADTLPLRQVQESSAQCACLFCHSFTHTNVICLSVSIDHCFLFCVGVWRLVYVACL